MGPSRWLGEGEGGEGGEGGRGFEHVQPRYVRQDTDGFISEVERSQRATDVFKWRAVGWEGADRSRRESARSDEAFRLGQRGFCCAAVSFETIPQGL